MKIAVWHTGHEIADTVALALKDGLNADMFHTSQCNPSIINEYDAHIGYGILRGTEVVFKESEKASLPWFNVDRGYFKASHYDGYYRISLRGTQQADLEKVIADYSRCQILLEQPQRINEQAHTLICPPTPYVAKFFGVNQHEWMTNLYNKFGNIKYVLRCKGEHIPVDEQLTNCLRVVTFNSSVGWEALRRGIPVYSDENHSIVGAYQKSIVKPLHLDYKSISELFAMMSSLQLTLAEIKSGELCNLLKMLLPSL